MLGAASLAILVTAALASTLLSPRGAVSWLLGLMLLAWALCIGTVGVAGLVLRDLSRTSLLLLAVLWLLLAAVTVWREGSLAGAGARLRTGLRAARDAASWPPVSAALVVVAVSLAWRALLAARLPVSDLLGWQYHLVFVDVWLQANALVRVPQNIWTDGWPAAGELLTTWLAAFTRTDTLTGFTGLLPIPVAVVAVIGLARGFGASRRSSILVGLLLAMIPAILAMAGTTYVDTAFVAAVAAAWWLGLRMVRGERDVSIALLFGIAVGLALGIKGTSFVLVLPMAAVVGICLLLDLQRGMARRTDRLSQLTQIAAVVVPVIAFGASWYIKNALLHGNPIYPVGIGPFQGLDRGSFGAPPVPDEIVNLSPVAQVVASWAHDWQVSHYEYNQRPGGFGVAWLPILALATAGIALLARARSWAALGLVVAPTVVAMAWLTSPWYARYTLFLAAVALAVAAVALDRLTPRFRLGAEVLLVVLASVSVVVANVHPNVSIPADRREATSVLAYVQLIAKGPGQRRSVLGEPPRCRRDHVDIPRGARVAVEDDFFTPHAVVGRRFARVLTQPPPAADDVAGLLDELRRADAGWLVTRRDSSLHELASANPEHFAFEGRLCIDGRLWQVLGTSGP